MKIYVFSIFVGVAKTSALSKSWGDSRSPNPRWTKSIVFHPPNSGVSDHQKQGNMDYTND